jgi:L-ascorbate metabolism protein UlaG (beta-lactamase superfamily)
MITSRARSNEMDMLQNKPTRSISESASVMLEYIGNSCILITAPDGTRIVSDPYHDSPRPPSLERLPSDLAAEAVTVSHSHPDHNNRVYRSLNLPPYTVVIFVKTALLPPYMVVRVKLL